MARSAPLDVSFSRIPMTEVHNILNNNRRPSSWRVSVLNPLCDPRWGDFVERHPDAGIFHSTGWLQALHRTYGYEPQVVTTSRETEPLSNAVVFCRVRSLVTGPRLVSLPFSDHCDPLVEDTHQLEALIAFLEAEVERGLYRYLEMRPLHAMRSSMLQRMHLRKDDAHCIHYLDLNRSLDDLYKSFHKKSVQCMIRKAKRERLSYEDGCSEELLSKFYKLLLMTRRRHQLPPQSMTWFRNLAGYLGHNLKVRVVSKDGRPIAGAITTHFRDISTYKYSCSDARYHNLGGTVLILWRAIQDAKAASARWFDFGRSDEENKGLKTFKEHWGTERKPLPYYRYPSDIDAGIYHDLKLRLMRKACAYLLDLLLTTLGGVLYKHVG